MDLQLITEDEILDSFKLKRTLNPDIFDIEDGKFSLKPDIRKGLLAVTEKFLEFLKIEFFIHDVILTGSLANYNWSKFSDCDLHILIDFSEAGHDTALLKEFFDSKRVIWNSLHAIDIRGYSTELYVQDVNEKHESTGIYSVLNNKWIAEPHRQKVKIDKKKIKEKVEQWMDAIDNLEKNQDEPNIMDEIDLIKERLKKFRQAGLDEGGEYSYENLVFKYLRRNNYIKKLLDLKTQITDKRLSLTQ